MSKIHIELIGDVNLYIGLGFEIIASIILGGLIGFDREKKMKSAGIKTNILICLGSTLYTFMAYLNFDKFNTFSQGDPSRVAAQIISGIGFLGAGAIIQARGKIIGLTTAATIWVVAAIGVTIGSGYPILAMIVTTAILCILKFLQPIYRLIESHKDYLHYHLEVLSRGPIEKILKQMILLEVDSIYELNEEILNEKTGERIYNIYISNHPRKISSLARNLKSIIHVEKIHYYHTKGRKDSPT